MPIYEYRGPACGHEFEVMQKMSEAPIKICPQCGAEEVKKLVSTTAFVLKGSGWYKDHYGLKSGGSAASGESSAASSTPAAPAPAASNSGGSSGSSST
jgi:putative FmdB family regulatory protein